MARYANWQSGRAQTSECVGSTPTCATPASAGFAFGRAVGRQAACKAAALWGNVGSIPTRGTDDMARSSNGSGRQVLNLRVGVRFPHGSLGRRPDTVM